MIVSNDALTDLLGLDGLTGMKGNVEIVSNDRLESLLGLHNLTEIGGGLFLVDNASLTDVDRLSSLSLNRGDTSKSVRTLLSIIWVDWST